MGIADSPVISPDFVRFICSLHKKINPPPPLKSSISEIEIENMFCDLSFQNNLTKQFILQDCTCSHILCKSNSSDHNFHEMFGK